MKKRVCLTCVFLILCTLISANASLKAISAPKFISKAFCCGELGFDVNTVNGKTIDDNTNDVIRPDAAADQPQNEEFPNKDLPSNEVPVNEAVLTKTITTASFEEDGLYISNLANADISVAELLAMPEEKRGKTVLILHSHGCEAYTPTKENNYAPTSDFRTTDTGFNVVRVGDKIEDVLRENGISVIHDRTLCDYPSFNDSYANSLALAKRYVEGNGDIGVILDVHRDSITGGNGEQVRTISKENTAQMMLVVGTDKSGLEHPLWRQNLSFALKLQKRISARHPSLMRPINLRKQRFNQHLTSQSLILEVGTDGNSLEEALSAAEIFACELAEYLS